MNCSRCGWLLEEADQKCPACGLAREQPQTRGPGRTLPLVPAVAAFAAVAGAYYLGVHRAAVSRNAAPAAASSPAAPPVRLTVAQSSAAVSTSISVASAPVAAQAAVPGIARLPPVPKSTPNGQTIYGVVYDLATLAPVAGVPVEFHTQYRPWPSAKTDENGWYRVEFPPAVLEQSIEVVARKDGYRGVWQERDPPIASLPPGRRHAIPEENSRKSVMIKLWARAPLAELDLALEPTRWPDGFAAPRYSPAEEPPAPAPADDASCRIYGVVYDLATKIPIRDVDLGLERSSELEPHPYTNIRTDNRGHYQVVMGLRELADGISVVPQHPIPGYVPGVAADRKPSLRGESESERKRLAGEIEIGAALLPAECPDGIELLNLVFVPSQWP